MRTLKFREVKKTCQDHEAQKHQKHIDLGVQIGFYMLLQQRTGKSQLDKLLESLALVSASAPTRNTTLKSSFNLSTP